VTDKSFLIYFWQGRDCSKNEKGTSAALSMNLAKKYPGASQIRVIQGKEPQDFLRLFKGKKFRNCFFETIELQSEIFSCNFRFDFVTKTNKGYYYKSRSNFRIQKIVQFQ
jgi:hypothetical protein